MRKRGSYLRFDQEYCGQTLVFDGKIHHISTVNEEVLYFVEVLLTNGRLWALVPDYKARDCDIRNAA